MHINVLTASQLEVSPYSTSNLVTHDELSLGGGLWKVCRDRDVRRQIHLRRKRLCGKVAGYIKELLQGLPVCSIMPQRQWLHDKELEISSP